MNELSSPVVKDLLIGDNPFIGVSHLTQEKALEETKEASVDNKMKVLQAALDSGANGFTFSTHKDNLELLNYTRLHQPELLHALNYYIVVPYSQSFVSRANVSGTPGLTSQAIKGMLLRPQNFLETVSALASLKPDRLLGTFLRNELAPFLDILPASNVKAILLHETITELMLAFRLADQLRSLANYFDNTTGIPFGLETRNFGQLCEYLSTLQYWPDYIMTPINPLGYQMTPDKKHVETCLEQFNQKSRIIAINILASGASSLNEAITYLQPFKNYLYAVTSASTKPHRMSENFLQLSERLM
jgi:hypothetical protein